jgi:hypothetical protein
MGGMGIGMVSGIGGYMGGATGDSMGAYNAPITPPMLMMEIKGDTKIRCK